MENKKILWVDDDHFLLHRDHHLFIAREIDIEFAGNPSEALSLIDSREGNYDLIITDICMPPGKNKKFIDNRGGYETGLVFSAIVKKNYPSIPVIGYSIEDTFRIRNWFDSNNYYYICKLSDSSNEKLFSLIERILYGVNNLNIFIVHGHDTKSKLELKNYLQNVLKVGEPIILDEQSNNGNTIIEKFEEFAKAIDFVFVLLTPDDIVVNKKTDINSFRARQNVIFELGYFLGRLGRKSGKILLLYKKPVEIPSDINGIIYIDVSNGINSSSEEIRKELFRDIYEKIK